MNELMIRLIAVNVELMMTQDESVKDGNRDENTEERGKKVRWVTKMETKEDGGGGEKGRGTRDEKERWKKRKE